MKKILSIVLLLLIINIGMMSFTCGKITILEYNQYVIINKIKENTVEDERWRRYSSQVNQLMVEILLEIKNGRPPMEKTFKEPPIADEEFSRPSLPGLEEKGVTTRQI